MSYCIYLRKSRADYDAEQRGEGETLARHEKSLIELSKRQKLNVTKIYREIISGETIASRPIAQKLLSEVEQGLWDGVLVMEVERLARGDTIDQGIVAQAFKFSNTLIVTPVKTYNPNDEFDEEFFEFGLFMSRREYKTINRRLQGGRLASVKEGKYVGNKAPFGYVRKKLEHDKGYTLEPDAEQSEVIKLIFLWYVQGVLQPDGTRKRLGVSLIVRKLNSLGIKPLISEFWVTPSVRDILINPVYIGKVRWNWRSAVKQVTDGKITKSRPRSKDVVLVDGLHPAIVDDDTFYAAQEFMTKNPARPLGERIHVQNPLASIIFCGKCGRRMIRRPKGTRTNTDTIMCPVTACNNVSVALPVLEATILKNLEEWVTEYKLKWETIKPASTSSNSITMLKNAYESNKSEIATLIKQLNNTYDLLEQGLYTSEVFLNRNKTLSEQINSLEEKNNVILQSIQSELNIDEAKRTIIPKVEHLLNVYSDLDTAQAKNDLLKEVLNRVIYEKDTKTKRNSSPNNFRIELYPKIPNPDI